MHLRNQGEFSYGQWTIPISVGYSVPVILPVVFFTLSPLLYHSMAHMHIGYLNPSQM
jgi:hypothetical protein